MSRERRDWDAIAELDPRWAVLSAPDRKYGRWDDEAFFATGEEEVAGRMRAAEELGRPARRGAALDFGCGLGRTTQALGSRFDRCVGIDISEAMVERARELATEVDNCEFVVGDGEGLPFEDGSFDLTYSSVVLQHLPGVDAIEHALRELVRVTTADGLLVFELPPALSLARRVQPRRTAYRVLRSLGVGPRFLYWRLGLHPMRMTPLPEGRVRRAVADAGGDVLRMDTRTDPRDGLASAIYYAAGAPSYPQPLDG